MALQNKPYMATDPDPTMAACLIVIKQVNSAFLDDITHFIQHSQSIFRYLYGKKPTIW
jgi:hypothetical protein